jgi:serine/threonine-protein kinase
MYEAGSLIASRYRLINRVAIGGMGEVWVAEDQALHRKVATKLVKPEYATDPVFHERLLAEARAAAAVDNPHVVDIYDVGSVTSDAGDNLSYISMELLSGRSFVELMRDGPMPANEVADMMTQVGEALATAHQRGVVHRDIKPANLMRDSTGRVTVLDFGIARAADSAALTAAGHMIGTARYISPEQVAGEAATGASDVYSLGVVAYQCLTGSPPFDEGSDVATALAHRDQVPPPLPSHVPIALAALIEACLSKDPGQRPAASEVARLAGSLVDDAVAPAAQTAVMPVPVDAAPAPATSELATPLREEPVLPVWLEWRRVGLVGAVAAGLILVATLIGFATDGGSSAAGRHASGSTLATSAKSATHPAGVRVQAGDYVGLTYAQAAQKLVRRGLVAVPTGGPATPTALVVGIQPTGRVAPGGTVTLSVAKPPPSHPKPVVKPKHAPKPVPPGHEKHGPGPGHGEGD